MSAAEISESGQYLTFILDQEVYALDITQVREVLDLTEVTKVPRMPEFMRGVINLRGGVVPVVDLRLKFDMRESERTVDTCIIIMELDIDGERTFLGALADSVQEVITLEADQ
ncbi:MAG: purine-binding chemotaxis protein CheW, partial [Deltaproteobacteria bacterium]|nr:purine-binding chemotaxis protein CheW [Deltaproteobacteria bacterium]